MGIFDQDQRPPSRGIGSRLIIGAVIVLIGLFMYWNQTEVNPVTGEKQHVAISPDQEIRLGIESAPKMAYEMGGEIPANDPRAQEVERIGQMIVEHSNAKESPWQFKFHLLADSDTVNAFALPGGQIFITLGLYEKLQTEAQLAGVLGHEIGHVIERHTAQQMAKSQLGQWLIVAVGTAASDPNHSAGSNNAAMVAALVNQMFQLHYSRADESEADQWGLMLTEQAGFDPSAMIEVMKILKAASKGSSSFAMFQTHPDPDLRIEQIKEYLAKHPPRPGLREGRRIN